MVERRVRAQVVPGRGAAGYHAPAGRDAAQGVAATREQPRAGRTRSARVARPSVPTRACRLARPGGWEHSSRDREDDMRAIVMRAMGCLASAVAAERVPTPAPPLATFDLGRHHRPVSTRKAAAQRAFDQGLVWRGRWKPWTSRPRPPACASACGSPGRAPSCRPRPPACACARATERRGARPARRPAARRVGQERSWAERSRNTRQFSASTITRSPAAKRTLVDLAGLTATP